MAAIMTMASVLAQERPRTPINPETIPTTPPAVAKLGPGLYRIGEITVDTAKREASVAGKVNAVETLEFVANTRDGLKAYESALTLDTYAVTFNAAMLLLGLDKDHAEFLSNISFRPHHKGIASTSGSSGRGTGHVSGHRPSSCSSTRRPASQFPRASGCIPDQRSVPEGPTQKSTRYVADIDGVLIGFVHSPAPIIESVPVPASAATGSSC